MYSQLYRNPPLLQIEIRQSQTLICQSVTRAGVLGAVAATRLLELQLYEIGSGDPVTFVAVSAFLLLVGTLACYLPVRRALRIDPVEALRTE